jgi:Rrf2 family nitric oxide-sensitive transcriptional repressor
MRLNKSTSHAIRILVDCGRADGRLLKVADVSERLGITPQNVFKIVHILSRADLVSAMRGPNGGVRLARPADQIRIGDVVRAMESTEIELDTENRTRLDRQISVGVNRVLDSALDAFISILDQHTLADLVGGVRDELTTLTEPRRHRKKAPAPSPASSLARTSPRRSG